MKILLMQRYPEVVADESLVGVNRHHGKQHQYYRRKEDLPTHPTLLTSLPDFQSVDQRSKNAPKRYPPFQSLATVFFFAKRSSNLGPPGLCFANFMRQLQPLLENLKHTLLEWRSF